MFLMNSVRYNFYFPTSLVLQLVLFHINIHIKITKMPTLKMHKNAENCLPKLQLFWWTLFNAVFTFPSLYFSLYSPTQSTLSSHFICIHRRFSPPLYNSITSTNSMTRVWLIKTWKKYVGERHGRAQDGNETTENLEVGAVSLLL